MFTAWFGTFVKSSCWYIFNSLNDALKLCNSVSSLNFCVTNTEHSLLHLVRAIIASAPKSLGCAFSCSEPLVSILFMFCLCPLFCFIIIFYIYLIILFFSYFETSLKASVNGLTSPLLLEQCGVGPFFALCVQRRARPPMVNRGPWHSGGHVR